MKILLVDDNMAIVDVVSMQIFEITGIMPDVAYDSTVGLLKATEEAYDIIFLDYYMPKKSGLEVAAAIRELFPPHSSAKIFALTGDGRIETADAIRVGVSHEKRLFDGLLIKPFDLNALGLALGVAVPPSPSVIN